MPLWTDAYLADTKHLTTIEHGAYLLLLMTAWRTRTYDLPDDDKMLAKFSGLTAKQWARIRPTIISFFNVENGRWWNNRMREEADAVRRQLQQRSDNGRANALKRWKSDMPPALQRQCQKMAPIPIEEIDMTLTESPEPTPILHRDNSVANATAQSAPDPRAWIFNDLLTWLKATSGRSEGSLRGWLGKCCATFGDSEVISAGMLVRAPPIPVDPVSAMMVQLKGKVNGHGRHNGTKADPKLSPGDALFAGFAIAIDKLEREDRERTAPNGGNGSVAPVALLDAKRRS